MIQLSMQSEPYAAPKIEMLDVMVERGFANSSEAGVSTMSFQEGGDTEYGDEWE